MNAFPNQLPYWQYKTDMTKAEKAEFQRHRELAFRLAFWWEDNAYFADILPHWHRKFAFGEFEPIQKVWTTRFHRKTIFHATAKSGKIVPIELEFKPWMVADAVVGAVGVRASERLGNRHAYAEAGVIGYPNWETEAVRFLHLDIDYPYLKKLWKEQERPDRLRVDRERHAVAWKERKARELDRQLLQELGALVVNSNTGLHAHFYLLDPITPAEGRNLIVAIDSRLTGHVEQTNLGAVGDWDRRQPHLPLPIPRSRERGEFMRVPKLLLDFFVEPEDWNVWKAVQVEAGELWRGIDGQGQDSGSGFQPSRHPAKALGPGAGAVTGHLHVTPQQQLLNRIRRIFEPYLFAVSGGTRSTPSIVDGHSPVVPDIEDGESQAWFLAGHIHRFETWADAERFVEAQSHHVDRQTHQDRLTVARWMWHAGSGRYSDGLDAALTPALLARVANEVISRIRPSGNLVNDRLQAKRLRIGVGILSALLDARKKQGHRFFKTFDDLAVAYDEPDTSNLGKRTLPDFFEPFFEKVDDGDVKVLPDQEWPTNIYEPTDLGRELLALSPPHPSPTKLEYRSVEPKQPVLKSRRVVPSGTGPRALQWHGVLKAANTASSKGATG